MKNTSLAAVKLQYVKELEALYGQEEIRSFFNWICEVNLRLKPFEINLRGDQILEQQQLTYFNEVLSELKQEKPIQQILGKSYFYGLEFKVNKHTLIPRPETEELVAMIIEDYKAFEPPIRILDIGSGSGCIPISLAKSLPQTQLYAIDISKQALDVAKENAMLNKVVVKFGEIDILKVSLLSSLFTDAQQFDVIVSNPPYVRESEKAAMKNNVLKFEPEGALYVSDTDPLLFYRHISMLAAGHLRKGGRLYFEINQYLGQQTKDLVLEAGFVEVELFKDGFEKDRMIRALR